jgi:hypothetical protein
LVGHVFEHNELVELLNEFRLTSFRTAPGLVQFRLKVFHNNKILWEYQGSTDSIVSGSDQPLSESVREALDMSGATELKTSFPGEEKKLSSSDWNEWFLRKTSLDEKGHKYLVPDTNFIYRHYSSKVLARHLDSAFSDCLFLLPNLVVLEIERRGNQSSQRSKDKGKDKRTSFYATSEIYFLRQKTKFLMLPVLSASLMSSFSEKAGRGLVDMWIRREVHDAIDKRYYHYETVVFLTCDLMNALAAEAEGLETCYFSRMPQDSFFVQDLEQLSDLLLATAIVHEKIRVDVIVKEDIVAYSYVFEGVWSGKTTSQWYSDCVKVTLIKNP